MLRLKQIFLVQYKNYLQSSFDFHSDVVGISGKNGKGKTNLLDAIYYSCFTRSYFTNLESLNVQFGQTGFRIEAVFEKDEKTYTVTTIYRGNKKEISVNGVPYEKFSQHIGKFPVVMIAPDDIELISGGSETRRKFIDTVLCQLDTEYMYQLLRYNKTIQQRNSLLKNYHRHPDDNLLDVLDNQLTIPAAFIFNRRNEFMHELLPRITSFYHHIAGTEDEPKIQYKSQLFHHSIGALLKENRQKDILLQRTSYGIHKDDIQVMLDNVPFRSIASQGQRKSLLFAFKLAEYQTLVAHVGYSLLLLDDVFEKLDEGRMNNLLQWVCIKNSGQVFITDTHRERLEKTFNTLGLSAQIIEP